MGSRALENPKAPYDLLSYLLRSFPIARAHALSDASASFDDAAAIFGAARVLTGSSEHDVS
jgi:hypothetical protein